MWFLHQYGAKRILGFEVEGGVKAIGAMMDTLVDEGEAVQRPRGSTRAMVKTPKKGMMQGSYRVLVVGLLGFDHGSCSCFYKHGVLFVLVIRASYFRIYSDLFFGYRPYLDPGSTTMLCLKP